MSIELPTSRYAWHDIVDGKELGGRSQTKKAETSKDSFEDINPSK